MEPTTPNKFDHLGLTINTNQQNYGAPAILINSNPTEFELDSTFQSLLQESFLDTPLVANGENGDFLNGIFDATASIHDDSSTSHDSINDSINGEEDDEDEEEPIKRKKIVAKKSSNKKKKDSSPMATNTNRVWSTVFVDPSAQDLTTEVLMKTRRDKPSEFLPDKMYSSLKYEIIQKAKGKLLSNVPLLLCRAAVVDATTFEEIKKKKPVLKGTIESALTKEPTNKSADEFECKMKVQFDFSYHQDKRLVALELRFYLNDKLDQPIMIKRSCPLKVYARKPNKTKRKREEDKEEKIKKIKETQENEFNDFAGQLEKCFEMANKFAGEEKKLAVFTIMQKFAQSFGSDAIVMANQPSIQHNFTDSSSEGGDFF